MSWPFSNDWTRPPLIGVPSGAPPLELSIWRSPRWFPTPSLDMCCQGFAQRLLGRLCAKDLEVPRPVGQLTFHLRMNFSARATCFFTRATYWRQRSRRSPLGAFEPEPSPSSEQPSEVRHRGRPHNICRAASSLATRADASAVRRCGCTGFGTSSFDTLRASSNAVFAVDCSCPKACNAASRRATFEC